MSREDVDSVRRIWRELSRMRFPAEEFDPEAEWHTAVDEPDADTYRGPADIGRMLTESWELFLDRYSRPDEFIDAGEWVLVPFHGGGKWRASGMPVEFEETHAYRLSARKVVEVREYRTRDEALQAHPAAGLCDSCRHQRIVKSGRGSRFSLCELSKTDSRFPKYPRLPVRECSGYEERSSKRLV